MEAMSIWNAFKRKRPEPARWVITEITDAQIPEACAEVMATAYPPDVRKGFALLIQLMRRKNAADLADEAMQLFLQRDE
jgi:hypothetical protein